LLAGRAGPVPTAIVPPAPLDPEADVNALVVPDIGLGRAGAAVGATGDAAILVKATNSLKISPDRCFTVSMVG